MKHILIAFHFPMSKVPSDDEEFVIGWIPERNYFSNYQRTLKPSRNNEKAESERLAKEKNKKIQKKT